MKVENLKIKCILCGNFIKKWAVAKCDVCQGNVCMRHRPSFIFNEDGTAKMVSFWMCPKCKKIINQNK